jgi:hypothetical protein
MKAICRGFRDAREGVVTKAREEQEEQDPRGEELEAVRESASSEARSSPTVDILHDDPKYPNPGQIGERRSPAAEHSNEQLASISATTHCTPDSRD